MGTNHLYHGTAELFESFCENRVGSKHADVMRESGEHDEVDPAAFYFSDDLETAIWYAKSSAVKNSMPEEAGIVLSVELSFNNPLEVNFMGEGREYLAEEIAKAKLKGCDGLICRNFDDGGVSDHYIAFSPSSVTIKASQSCADLAKAQGIPTIGSASSMVMLGDLPRDMREELFNEHASNSDPDAIERVFYKKSVPSGLIVISDLVIDQVPQVQLERYLTQDIDTLPPIVIADGRLIDGMHRIAAARLQGKTELRYIDVTGIIDTEAGGYISAIPAKSSNREILAVDSERIIDLDDSDSSRLFIPSERQK